jgi:hypothetical protein
MAEFCVYPAFPGYYESNIHTATLHPLLQINTEIGDVHCLFHRQCVLHPTFYILDRSRGNKKGVTEIFETRALKARDNHKSVTEIFPTRARELT